MPRYRYHYKAVARITSEGTVEVEAASADEGARIAERLVRTEVDLWKDLREIEVEEVEIYGEDELG